MSVTTTTPAVGPLTRLAMAMAAAMLIQAAEADGSFLDGQGFTTAEEMVPMRDGVKLHTVVCTPERTTGRLRRDVAGRSAT